MQDLMLVEGDAAVTTRRVAIDAGIDSAPRQDCERPTSRSEGTRSR
jgi:hypothetical protein